MHTFVPSKAESERKQLSVQRNHSLSTPPPKKKPQQQSVRQNKQQEKSAGRNR